MRRILACAGVNGDERALQSLMKLIDETNPDAVLFAGGILGRDTSDRERFLVRFFEQLGRDEHFDTIIPRPHDGPLREFYRVAVNAESSFPHVFVVHGTLITRGEAAICGMGGRITEHEDAEQPVLCFSRATAEYYLRSLLHTDKPIKVMLLGDAPPGKLGGSPENQVVEELIHTFHPALCIVRGETEHRGQWETGRTLVVNPGQLSDGSAAWIDRTKNVVELLNV